MKSIAFDIGTVRIGVAASDALGIIASPVQVYTRGDDPQQDARDLAAIARAHGAERIVIGLPVSLRGKMELAAQQVRQFADALRAHVQVEVVLWDERMSTAIANKAMLLDDVSRAGRRDKVDQVAAAVILQSYLDAQSGPNTDGECEGR